MKPAVPVTRMVRPVTRTVRLELVRPVMRIARVRARRRREKEKEAETREIKKLIK